MITESGAIFTVVCIELTPGVAHFLNAGWSQFRAIARARPILAGSEIALLLRCGRCAGFRRGQFRVVAGLHPVVAVGHIPLVIGYRQCNPFGFRKF